MKIGINATAAFIKPRTGVEEYAYQLIKYLTMLEGARKHRFVLYSKSYIMEIAQDLPENFGIKRLRWPLPMWTQIRLAGEMAIGRPDTLFIPVHILPLVHPQNSVVTIHGLEYEHYPELYPKKHLVYIRWATKYALKNARKVIAVSESTKNDLVKLYGANPDKIEVVHHGVEIPSFKHLVSSESIEQPYILFIGRLESKKNINGLVKAFELLKKKYRVPHKLILVGPRGYGYNNSKFKIQNSKFGADIIEKGYVSEDEKWTLLKNADLFILPSFYEGFGMPILEAQAADCPVITSNLSSMPEIAGEGAVLIEPDNIEQIVQMVYKVISDKELKGRLIGQGRQNVKKFSWEKCAQETLKILEK